ncbi:expressed unknown protein [Seminavis robusta]|uniref:Uncharacterized protein n=1 Tax=Seminavis robusta TaxID=568900 RepID=A0A9N8F440_9STRA|nr:expressed unknown protein [Seminavis robusta]|eukprot:Sro3511_g348740.1 n/a (405) ;mRNA; f:1208-2422
MNRPRNVLLSQGDPREPVECKFQHAVGALKYSLTIHQTPEEEVWPGGALWDCGLLLAELLLAVGGMEALTTIHTLLPNDDDNEQQPNNKKHAGKNSKHASEKCTRTTNQLSRRLQTWLQQQQRNNQQQQIWKDSVESVLLHRSNLTVVELGCGVGLTGLVASIALGAVTTILTDLTVVVDQVTLPNLMQNTTQADNTKQQHKTTANSSSFQNINKKYPCRTLRHFRGGGKVMALPLCWGNFEEGERVLQVLKELQPSPNHNNTKGKGGKKGAKKAATDTSQNTSSTIYPDLILLGDVAYQHKPGAPSHFDILVESLQQLMPPLQNDNHKSQLLLFGTRLRMPASMDLLLLLQEHFTPVLTQPLPAQVLDPALEGVKHNMTIHIFTNKTTNNSKPSKEATTNTTK